MDADHHEDDSNIIVYDEEDPEIEDLLHGSAVSHNFKYDEDEHNDGDIYGGMSHELYNNIVEFKKNGSYPQNLNSRLDRSALSHWRARCSRYVMATDNETLMYCNQSSSISDVPKVVVKRGEVERVIGRIHSLIGHLGQKRTQMAVLKKLHWRSVRQDVKTYIMNCDFCNQKKVEGKKILKAPVDISSNSFGFTVEARSGQGLVDNDRLQISLIGYDEHEVTQAAMTKMTSYTFKETASELRGGRYGRTMKPNEFLTPGSSASFRRQPYIRRSRFTPYSTSYILPYTPKGPSKEPEFIIYNPARGDVGSYQGVEYEVEEQMVEDGRDHGQEQLHGEMLAAEHHLEENVVGRQTLNSQVKDEMHSLIYDSQAAQKRVPAPSNTIKTMRRTRLNQQATGISGRFSVSLAEGDRIDIGQNSADLLTPMEAVQSRAELVGLAPIMMMPTMDPEVVALQKELLTRQLQIQELQEKVLQRHLDESRLPIARFEEIDPQGEQLLEDAGEGVMEELNVMDSGDDDEIIKQYQTT